MTLTRAALTQPRRPSGYLTTTGAWPTIRYQ
jgi:hypothetical protein